MIRNTYGGCRQVESCRSKRDFAPRHVALGPCIQPFTQTPLVTGVAVTFKGTYNADKTRISLNSFKDIIILSNPSTSQGNLGGPLRSFKVLHVLARFPNTVDGGVTVQQQQTAYSNLASMWSQCSNNFLTFDTSSKVVGPVELPTTNFSVCPSDALFNTWMSTALDYARAQGINPADYPYHAFTWPQEIQRTCGWAGLAYVSCYNNSNGGTPCWAMYMAPYSADNRILMHETGHNIGVWLVVVGCWLWHVGCWLFEPG